MRLSAAEIIQDEICVSSPSWAEGVTFNRFNMSIQSAGGNQLFFILGTSIYWKVVGIGGWIFDNPDLATFNKIDFSSLIGYTTGDTVKMSVGNYAVFFWYGDRISTRAIVSSVLTEKMNKQLPWKVGRVFPGSNSALAMNTTDRLRNKAYIFGKIYTNTYQVLDEMTIDHPVTYYYDIKSMAAIIVADPLYTNKIFLYHIVTNIEGTTQGYILRLKQIIDLGDQIWLGMEEFIHQRRTVDFTS